MSGNLNTPDEPQPDYELHVELTIQKGRANQLVRQVTGPVFTLGTDHTCDMVLGDEQFPDVHSYVCIRDGIVSLRHLGQGPPVTVNGRDVRWGELRDGDRIRTGSYEFRIGIGQRKVLPKPHTPQNEPFSSFAGKLDQLPSWWSAHNDIPVNWASLTSNKSPTNGRF